MLRRISICGVYFLSASLLTVNATAAVQKPVLAKPNRILKSAGVVTGGESGPGLALMDFRRSSSPKNKLERIVLDFGAADMTEKKGLIGYYHAELQDNPARLILELPQTYTSRLDDKAIRQRLRDSLYVREAFVEFDRNLQSLTMVFQLREPVQLKVTPVRDPRAAGKIVLDFMPVAKTLPSPKAGAVVPAKAKAAAGSKQSDSKVRR